jgi:hypothetical protein
MARPQSGPPLIIPALSYATLTIAGVVLGAGAPRPDADATQVWAYGVAHPEVLRWGAFLAFGASIPLAIWSATVYRRLRAWGITAAGSAIALAGGLLAATLAAIAGLVTWVWSRVEGVPELAAVLRDLTFAAGGPGFVSFFGLLLLGVGIPMLLLGIRRPLAIAGVVIAVVCEVSTVTLLTLGAAFTLPIGRFGGLLWLLAASLLLPATRPRAGAVDDAGREGRP